MLRPIAALTACFALSFAACSDDAPDAGAGAPDAATTAQTTFGGDRPVEIRVPSGYDPSRPAPLLLVLHGYGAAGTFNDIYMKLTTIADAKGFFYVSPNGTRDKGGRLFWNATESCCNFDGIAVDDVAYLSSLVEEIRKAYAIDPKRIFVVGHSNGGYMANRLACERADLFAAAVSWAGANFADPSRCKPSAPIGFLQIHGTSDALVPFGPASGDAGGPVSGNYPGAAGTTAIWAEKNGCAPDLVPTGASLRVNADSPGADTKVARHDGCKGNGAAELWPVEGAGHIFSFSPDAVSAIWSFLDAHAKR